MTVLVWAGTDAWRAEFVDVQRRGDAFTARGVQLGRDPLPYRVDYSLQTADGWLTRTLEVRATGDGWWRTLHLAHDGRGSWTSEAAGDGSAPLPAPGGDAAALAGALDCDLGLSPLTNTMPILRHRLHHGGDSVGGAVASTMAWVSVPDLQVHRSAQQYEPVRRTAAGAVVRYRSGTTTAELTVDPDGFVIRYPGLAQRTAP